MVVAAVPLGHRRAAKFGAEHDQRVVEHPPAGQILYQCCGTAIDFAGRALDVLLHAAVVVPVAVVELNEPHASLRQPPGQETVCSERAVTAAGAIKVECFRGLVGEIHEAGNARLHLEGEFILGQPGSDLGIIDRRVTERVEPRHRVDDVSLPARRRSGGRVDVEHRISLGAKFDALEPARQQT